MGIHTSRSLEEFSRRMIKRGNRAIKQGDKLLKMVALAVDEALVAATPVDTGRAISNWIPSTGQESDKVRKEAFVPGEHGSTEAENIATQVSKMVDVLRKHKTGESIFMTNNLDYIGELNKGSSPQAEADFVRMAAAAASKIVNSSRRIKIVED